MLCCRTLSSPFLSSLSTFSIRMSLSRRQSLHHVRPSSSSVYTNAWQMLVEWLSTNMGNEDSQWFLLSGIIKLSPTPAFSLLTDELFAWDWRYKTFIKKLINLTTTYWKFKSAESEKFLFLHFIYMVMPVKKNIIAMQEKKKEEEIKWSLELYIRYDSIILLMGLGCL